MQPAAIHIPFRQADAKKTRLTLSAAVAASWLLMAASQAQSPVVIQPAGSMILDTTLLAQCVTQFSEEDRWFFGVGSDEEVSTINNGVYGGQFVLNAGAYDYLKERIPLFDCPDADFVKTYYFRWWTYRKQIKNLGTAADRNLIVTEFIDPVDWADSTNAINAPLGHQIYEGRWLQDHEVTADYQRYWLAHPAARPRHYSAWLADAVLANHQVHPDLPLIAELLTSTTNRDNLETNHGKWIDGVGTSGGASRQSDGLFWQDEGYDAMEVSFGGSGKRPSINAYMFAEARAIAAMFRISAAADPANTAAYNAKAALFDQQAETLRGKVQTHLWDPTDEFFKTGYADFATGGTLQGRREEVGFTPWAFGLPADGGAVDYDKAWTHLGSFSTPVGFTSGAHDETGYNPGAVGSCCRWDGPVWPYATTLTLRAMANLLQDYQQGYINRIDYLEQLGIYTRSHRQAFTQNGTTRTISWLDESMVSGGGDAGKWTQIGVTRDGTSGNDNPRGFAYNHSGYIDLIITGLAGLRPATGDVVRVAPLLPDNSWDWFLLDKVRYHGRYLTILWDRTGAKYGRGAGLKVYADGGLIASAAGLTEVFGTLSTSPEVLLTSMNPPDGATGLLASTHLAATFDRLVQAGTGTIRLIKSTGNVLVESFDVASSSRLSFEGASLTIDPSNPLEAGGAYHILMDPAAIKGVSGNSFAGITDPSAWNFSIDGTPPGAIAKVPAPGAPAVPMTTDLGITFDEPVVKGSGNITVRRATDDLTVQMIAVSDAAVTVDGTKVTVGLADLAPGTYYIGISPGAFIDLSGNPFAGISGGSTWRFTISATARFINVTTLDEEADIVNTGGALVSAANFGAGEALTVNGLLHGAGSAGGTNLTNNMYFEGDYRNNASGLPDGTPLNSLFDGIAGANGITMSIGNLTVGQEYLFQTYWEANGTGHTLTITIEGDTVTKVGTRSPGALISYRFMATDNTLNVFIDRDDGATGGDPNNWLSGYSLQKIETVGAPSLNGTNPPDGASSMPPSANLIATFSRPVRADTGTIRIYQSNDTLVEVIAVGDTTPPGTVTFTGADVTVDPTHPLVNGIAYYVLIDSTAITDASGIPFAGLADKTAWNFTAGIAAPLLTASLLDQESDIVNTGGPLVSAANFGGGALTVNGILHGAGTAGGANLSYSPAFQGNYRNNASGLPDGTPLNSLLDGIAGGSSITMSISGLTVGQEYLYQAYWEANAGQILTITMEGDTLVPVPDQSPAVLISYRFTAADTTLNIFIDRTESTGPDGNNWLSGYSLQKIAATVTYASWIAGFPEVNSQAGFTDDPDGDGLANGLEAWFGSHPGEFNVGLAGLTTAGTTTTFTHPRNATPPADLSGFYQWSPNLTDWYAGDGAAGPPGGPTVTISPGTIGTTTTVTATASRAIESLFLRAAVRQN